jgi:signal peptidase I
MKNSLALVRTWLAAGTAPCGRSRAKRRFLKLAMLVTLSCASYLFFSRMVVTAVEVKGASMSPTLAAGDRFLLNRFAYLHREPQRGELVVLKDPETSELIVKRIVGMPCETVIMQSDAAYVNGRRLFEPYVSKSVSRDRSPLGKATVIPRDHYFVLGDNRNRSVDSREFGTVSRDRIIGVITL